MSSAESLYEYIGRLRGAKVLFLGVKPYIPHMPWYHRLLYKFCLMIIEVRIWFFTKLLKLIGEKI